MTGLLLLSTSLFAQIYPSNQLVLSGVSYHITDRTGGQEWNQIHFGVGYRRAFDEDFAASLVYVSKNSIGARGLYATVDYTPIHVERFAAGIFVGAATGYHRPVSPIAGLVVQLRFPSIIHDFRYGPRAPRDNKGSAVFTYLMILPF